MDSSYKPRVCVIPLWCDDNHYERLIDIIEGKIILSDEVRANIVFCGREKLKQTRAKHKRELTIKSQKSNFATITKPKKKK